MDASFVENSRCTTVGCGIEICRPLDATAMALGPFTHNDTPPFPHEPNAVIDVPSTGPTLEDLMSQIILLQSAVDDLVMDSLLNG